MHKYIGLTLAAALTLTGCQADNSQVIKVEYQPTPTKVVEKKETTEADRIMEDFNRLLAKEPREDEVFDFIDKKNQQGTYGICR